MHITRAHAAACSATACSLVRQRPDKGASRCPIMRDTLQAEHPRLCQRQQQQASHLPRLCAEAALAAKHAAEAKSHEAHGEGELHRMVARVQGRNVGGRPIHCAAVDPSS